MTSLAQGNLAMAKLAPIMYRDFYDVPRAFLVRDGDRLLLFDSPFEDARDEYADRYAVYLMPELTEDELGGSWVDLRRKALRRLGCVSVVDVRFDDTLREYVDLAALDGLHPCPDTE